MAGLDASIYNNVGRIEQPQNPLAQLAQVEQIKRFQQQGAQADRAEQQQNALMSLVGSPEFATLPTAQKAARLQGVGAFDQAGKLVTADAAASKDARAGETSAFELKIKQLDAMANLAGTVVDQPSYDRARQIATEQLGLDVSKWAPQYNPEGVKQFAQATLSAKDRLMASTQAQAQALTARGQDMTQQTAIRGQDMGDARQRELASLQRDAQTQQRAQVAEEKGTAATDKKVTAFATQLDKTNVPQFESLLGDIEADISKVKDIPGFGGVMGNLPTFLQSEEGRALRQKIATLRNLTLKDRSGAAVTNQELTRLLEELGTGYFKTDADLTRGLSGVRKNLDSVKQNVVAGVDDATLQEYQTRGGMALSRGGAQKPAGAAPAAPGASTPPPGAVAHLKANPGLRAAFEAKYGAGSAAGVLGQ